MIILWVGGIALCAVFPFLIVFVIGYLSLTGRLR
jgi:hypothetical protein